MSRYLTLVDYYDQQPAFRIQAKEQHQLEEQENGDGSEFKGGLKKLLRVKHI